MAHSRTSLLRHARAALALAALLALPSAAAFADGMMVPAPRPQPEPVPIRIQDAFTVEYHHPSQGLGVHGRLAVLLSVHGEAAAVESRHPPRVYRAEPVDQSKVEENRQIGGHPASHRPGEVRGDLPPAVREGHRVVRVVPSQGGLWLLG